MYCTIVYLIMIGTRTQNDPTPGNLVSCMTFVQRALPIALARPYVEQFLPKGTKVKQQKARGSQQLGVWLGDLCACMAKHFACAYIV